MVPNTNKILGNGCSVVFQTLLIGLIVSTAAAYMLNLQFFFSVSRIRLDLKKIASIVNDIKFAELLLSRDGGMERSVANASNITRSKEFCPWPPKYLRGREALNRTVIDIENLTEIYSFMKDGHYKPLNCTPVKKVAIIVPYRDREAQLKIFLNNVIPRIYRQQLEFGIYIVEQASGVPFNRGMLSNIGFKEAMLDIGYDCIVIHDLDILPEDDRNLYTCTNNPIHMAVKVEQFNYSLIYEQFAGGVTTFSREQYIKINGFSNQFFGWGGEDDDLYERLKLNNYTLIRPFKEYGYCGSVKHKVADKANNRMSILKLSRHIWQKDGLVNLEYQSILKKRKGLYVWVYVNINMDKYRQKLKMLREGQPKNHHIGVAKPT